MGKILILTPGYGLNFGDSLLFLTPADILSQQGYKVSRAELWSPSVNELLDAANEKFDFVLFSGGSYCFGNNPIVPALLKERCSFIHEISLHVTI